MWRSLSRKGRVKGIQFVGNGRSSAHNSTSVMFALSPQPKAMNLTGGKIHCQTWFDMNTALKSPVGPDSGLRAPMGARSKNRTRI